MKHKIFILMILLSMSLIPNRIIAATVPASDQVAIALLIDNSGSMKRTDPDNKRFIASRMVLELLSSSDYFSVTTFADEAVDLYPMAPLSPDEIIKARQTISAPPVPTGDTDYLKALNQAEKNLSLIPDANIRKFVIFLTDGKPDPQGNGVDINGYMDEVRKKVHSLGESGIPIYTVGFDSTNQALLEEMAAMTRGASFQGTSSAIAESFFGILAEMKNRYTVLDTKEIKDKEPRSLSVDESTSRITLLVSSKNPTEKAVVKDPYGGTVKPTLDEDQVQVYHLDQDSGIKEYSVSGNIKGTIKAVRDSMTKLWIEEPLNNSQLPLESEVTVKVGQTGTEIENAELKAVLKQNGSPLVHPITVDKENTGFNIKLGKLPQSGDYELEVGLYKRNQLITQTSSRFELKNIPVLKTSLLEEEQTWIQGDKLLVTGQLDRSGKTLKGLTDFEFLLEVSKENEKSTVSMLDDGRASSGDLIANDGVYSTILEVPAEGPLEVAVTVRGSYQNEPLLLTSSLTSNPILPPGKVKIIIPEQISIDENQKTDFKVEFQNESEYPESLSVSVNTEDIPQPPILLKPGETLTRHILLDLPYEDESVQLVFQPSHSPTKITQNRNSVRILRSSQQSGFNFWQIALLVGAAIIVAFGARYYLSKPKKKKPVNLEGNLFYHQGIGEPQKIRLQGSGPLVMSIGPGEQTETHIPAEIEQGFRITLTPVSSSENQAVVELTCSPPGILISHGQLKSSTLLSNNDEFTMAGLYFQYLLDSEDSGGKDVLTGKVK